MVIVLGHSLFWFFAYVVGDRHPVAPNHNDYRSWVFLSVIVICGHVFRVLVVGCILAEVFDLGLLPSDIGILEECSSIYPVWTCPRPRMRALNPAFYGRRVDNYSQPTRNEIVAVLVGELVNVMFFVHGSVPANLV